MKHEWRLIPCVIGLLSAIASAGTVELRRVARVEPGADVTLRDIALLQGDDALSLGDLVVIQGGDPALSGARARIEIDRLRTLIDARGVNWGLLTLRGGRCDLRLKGPAPATVRNAESPARAIAVAPTGPSVRTYIESRLLETFGVSDPAMARIRFEERDADLLAMGLEGRLLEVYTTGSSSRVPVSVTIYEGERLIERRQIRVEMLIEREVCVLSVPMRRGELIGADAMTRERRWLTPDVRPLSPEEAVGSEIRSGVEAGVVLSEHHVEAPIVVRRGGLVTVHYLSGQIILKTRARAMSDGRLGDRIKFEALGTRRLFMARVDASDRAIVQSETEAPGLLFEERATTDIGTPAQAQRPGVAVTRAE